MATTKTTTPIWENQSLSAGGADVTSSVINISTGYGGEVSIKITNGGTGPTVPAQCIIQTSPDNSEWYERAVYVAGTDSYSAGPPEVGVYSWIEDIPMGTKYVKLIAGRNTGQAVTIDADIVNVTAIS